MGMQVYAPVSVHPEGCPYGDTSCGAVKTDCSQFGQQGITTCSLIAKPCEQEGQYSASVWADGESKTIPAYYVDWDADEEFCRNVECGGGDWNPDGGDGKKCCGDDRGRIYDDWLLSVKVIEEDIPVLSDIENSTDISMAYFSYSMTEDRFFLVDKAQTVEYSFNISNCYLVDTVVYAKIYDDLGSSITGSVIERSGPDENYIYYADGSAPCVTPFTQVMGNFDAEPGRTYTLELYRGETNESIYESNFGFDEMALGVQYYSLSASTTESERYFTKTITETGVYIIHMVSQDGGNLNADTIKVYAIPDAFLNILDTYNNINPDNSIDQTIHIEIIPAGIGDDCQMVQGGSLCFDNDQQGGWAWLDADKAQGGIVHTICGDKPAVSDGTNWFGCNMTDINSPEEHSGSPVDKALEFGNVIRNIRNHDYGCYYTDFRWNLTECCGEDTCNSFIMGASFGGERLRTGGSREKSDGRYYCTSYSALQKDLDNIKQNDPLGISCTAATLPDGTSEGLVWTGDLCCGEADDNDEFYNDIDGKGGCWNSTTVYKNNYVKHDGKELREVLNYNGEFLGCAIDKKQYKENNEYLLDILDLHTGQPLVKNKELCTLLKGGLGYNAYCSYQEVWEKTSAANLSLSSAPVTVPVQNACCPADNCWNGEECVANQIDEGSRLTYFGYRCYDGAWVKAALKPNWNSTEVGFCPREEQCLVTMSGEADNNDNAESFYTYSQKPICINDNQYFLDSYCEKGNWTSRTRQIALAMLQKMEQEGIQDYSLYCDDYEKALPKYEGELPGICERENGYLVPCINNVCILDYEDHRGNQILIGTSYNIPIDSYVFEGDPVTSLCVDEKQSEAVQSSGRFVDCSHDEVWYNHDIESVIYNKYYVQGIYLENDNWFDMLGILLKDKIFSMLEAVQFWKPQSTVFGEPVEIKSGFITNASNFDRIYLMHAGDNTIVATAGKAVETVGDSASPVDIITGTFIAVSYSGFSGVDICQYVELYDDRFHMEYTYAPRAYETVVCNQITNDYYVFSRDDTGEDIWQDLTSKLRFE